MRGQTQACAHHARPVPSTQRLQQQLDEMQDAREQEDSSSEVALSKAVQMLIQAREEVKELKRKQPELEALARRLQQQLGQVQQQVEQVQQRVQGLQQQAEEEGGVLQARPPSGQAPSRQRSTRWGGAVCQPGLRVKGWVRSGLGSIQL